MTVEQERTGKSTVVLNLNGRLDTANAPQLERKIKQWGEDITELVLDFSGLSYISSMGLRVLLQAKKALQEEGRKLIIRNMNDSVREVFELTGFLHLMVQEEKFVVIRKTEQDAVILSLNGQMEAENADVVAAELSAIREANSAKNCPIAVILDVENLTHISSVACRLLKRAMEETAWDNRRLSARNVSVDMQAAFSEHSLSDTFNA